MSETILIEYVYLAKNLNHYIRFRGFGPLYLNIWSR